MASKESAIKQETGNADSASASTRASTLNKNKTKARGRGKNHKAQETKACENKNDNVMVDPVELLFK